MRIRRTLTLVILAAMALVPMNSGAAAPDGPYLQQVGDGGGNSGPIIRDFAMTAPLFDRTRFPVCGTGRCVERPTFPKYVGWGVVNFEFEGQQFLRVAMVKGSDDGLRWQAPVSATIQKPSGDVPFILGLTSTNFDVIFNGTQTTQGNLPNYPFTIYYKLAPVSNGTTVSSIHAADSEDGIHWVNDRAITQNAALPLVGGTGTAFTYGPSDVTFQPTASASATCAGASGTTPWNCRYVMLYSRFDGGTSRTGLAGSGDGLNFAAYPGPIFAPTPASWDQSGVGFESVRIRVVNGVKQYLMAYAGTSGGSCADFGCYSIGTASSADGVGWTKTSGGPMAPRALPNAIAEPGNLDALLNAEFVDDASGSGHSKVFFTKYANQPYPRPMDTFLAQTAAAPGAGPTITVASPTAGYRVRAQTPVEIYVNDTNGTLVGEDLGTLALDVDGVPIGGASFQKTVVTSYKNVGTKITIPGSALLLADGAHVFTVSIADRDGNVSTVSTSFTTDSTAPSTLVTGSPAGPVVGQTGLGTFTATTTENPSGVGIARVKATVRNPLNQVKSWESSAPWGFNVNQVSATTWNWNWVAPTADPHFLLPGEYSVTLSGIDLGGAVEGGSAANTVTILSL